MTVYHGSTFIVKNPDVAKSKNYLDFGKGFYVTTLKGQAEKWALRKKLFSRAVADDAVFKCVDMYFKGIWNEERTLNELRFYKQSNQICFVNQAILDKKLHFDSYYEVKNG